MYHVGDVAPAALLTYASLSAHHLLPISVIDLSRNSTVIMTEYDSQNSSISTPDNWVNPPDLLVTFADTSSAISAREISLARLRSMRATILTPDPATELDSGHWTDGSAASDDNTAREDNPGLVDAAMNDNETPSPDDDPNDRADHLDNFPSKADGAFNWAIDKFGLAAYSLQAIARDSDSKLLSVEAVEWYDKARRGLQDLLDDSRPDEVSEVLDDFDENHCAMEIAVNQGAELSQLCLTGCEVIPDRSKVSIVSFAAFAPLMLIGKVKSIRVGSTSRISLLERVEDVRSQRKGQGEDMKDCIKQSDHGWWWSQIGISRMHGLILKPNLSLLSRLKHDEMVGIVSDSALSYRT